MSDFDDLRQIREVKEAAEALARQMRLEEERQRADAQMRWRAEYIAHAESLHDTVVSVLEELRKAAYTSSRSSTINDLKVSGGGGSWAIGWSSLHEHSFPVTVHLRYESDGKTPCFVVNRAQVKIEDRWIYFETMTCGITREELLHTLRSLHPPQTVGAPIDVKSTYIGWKGLAHIFIPRNTPGPALREVQIAKRAGIKAAMVGGKPIPEPRYRPVIYQLAA